MRPVRIPIVGFRISIVLRRGTGTEGRLALNRGGMFRVRIGGQLNPARPTGACEEIEDLRDLPFDSLIAHPGIKDYLPHAGLDLREVFSYASQLIHNVLHGPIAKRIELWREG